MVLGFLSRFIDSNDRELRRIQPLVDTANSLEAELREQSDEEIRARIADIRAELVELQAGFGPTREELEEDDAARRRDMETARRKKENAALQDALDDALPEVFAAAREGFRRTLDMRPFDVQLLGAVVLHQGKISEMKTGEGKTLVAPIAAALNGLTGLGVHVVTPNDYLARRDPQWMGPMFHFLGISVGIVVGDEAYVFEPGYPTSDERLINLRPCPRREAYAADVTYGTNHHFGFDYLRDNLVTELDQRVQRGHWFAIVDEVDSILIDEARTPLIISGQAEESADLYYQFARLVPRLRPRPEGEEEGGDYFVDLKDKAVSATEEGIEKMEGWLGVQNLYDDPRLARYFDSALRAHALYKRDKEYIVRDGEIVIVDEFTGRQMPDRRWSEGLHQAVEAKEGLRVQRESVTLATVTFQNYFRLYDKLAGMTGTAMTEAEEFHKIYKLEVVSIPTNKPMIRDDAADLVFRNEMGKFTALIDEVVEMTEAGRPVLVGTVSVEKSEVLSELLKRRGIRHEVLNAKFHEKEAPIVAQAGRPSAVTIATNMAGRGTDIQLGGNPAGLASEMLHRQGLNPAEVDRETYLRTFAEAKVVCDADHEKVVVAGGLHIIGTERHDSRRIDNQLRGRAGRQGDPGSSRFYLSLDDDLMKRFASERVAGLMQRLGLDDDVAIESRLVSKTIEGAQTRVEGYNFDVRKRVVEFDDVISRQRETIYAERDKVLRNEALTDTVRAFIDEEIDAQLATYCGAPQPEDWNIEGFVAALRAMGLDGRETSEDVLVGIGTTEELSGHLRELADGRLEAKMAEVGETDWAMVERVVLLRTIDALWIEHLTELDDMRRGIGLRGYAQQDPLNEFKKEAFNLYDQLNELIRHQVATTIFRVSVVRQPAPTTPDESELASSLAAGAQALRAGAATAGAQAGGDGQKGPPAPGPAARPASAPALARDGRVRPSTPGTSDAAASAARNLPLAPALRNMQERLGDEAASPPKAGPGGPGAKLGRNDPCYCGSGLKYKKCHGR
jgi:preprotein translocase subunit SecA